MKYAHQRSHGWHQIFFSTRTKGVSDLGFSILSLVPGGWGGIDPVGSEE